MTVLLASPYSLAAGTEIVAQVEAHNAYGYSSASPSSSSGILVSTTPNAMSTPTMNNSTTTATSLVVDWTSLAVSAAGYSAATSYNLYWDAGTSGASFVSLVGESSDSLATSLTVTTGVSEGGSYQFKVRAKNIHGYGSFSSVATLVASSKPDAPSTVTTAYDSNGDVVVTWVAPDDNGSDITAYYVVFADEAETTYTPHTSCDAWADSTFVTTLTCTVSMNSLTAAPYSIPREDLISVKVQAYNSRGWGARSTVNTSGATAKTIPAQMTAPTRGTDTTTSRI